MVRSRYGPSAHRATADASSELLISACLIVRDEAEMLPDCVASIRQVADEIVVVDTGSTDGTPAVARRAGARVCGFAWCDDFAAARNAAMDRARGRWILQIDADERLVAPGGGPVDHATFRQRLSAPTLDPRTFEAIVLPLRVLSGRQEIAYLPRLFLRRPDRRYVRRIHETPFPGDRPQHFVRAEGLAEIRHLGYAPEIQASRNKANRNMRLCELALRERPADLELHYYYGRELNRAGRGADAIAHFAEAWNGMSPWMVGSGFWWLTVAALGEGLNSNGKSGLVLPWVRPLIERYPNVAHLHFIRGEALRLLGHLDQALASLRTALALPLAGLDWEPWTTKPFCWNAIGAIGEQLGRPDLALEAYHASLAIGPTPFAEGRIADLQGTANDSVGVGADGAALQPAETGDGVIVVPQCGPDR